MRAKLVIIFQIDGINRLNIFRLVKLFRIFFETVAEALAAHHVLRILPEFLAYSRDVYIYGALGNHNALPDFRHKLLARHYISAVCKKFAEKGELGSGETNLNAIDRNRLLVDVYLKSAIRQKSFSEARLNDVHHIVAQTFAV